MPNILIFEVKVIHALNHDRNIQNHFSEYTLTVKVKEFNPHFKMALYLNQLGKSIKVLNTIIKATMSMSNMNETQFLQDNFISNISQCTDLWRKQEKAETQKNEECAVSPLSFSSVTIHPTHVESSLFKNSRLISSVGSHHHILIKHQTNSTTTFQAFLCVRMPRTFAN